MLSYPSPRRRLLAPLFYIIPAFMLIFMLFSSLLGLDPCLSWNAKNCYKGYESEYSFDIDRADRAYASWMKSIPDHVNLTSLSIPGTHDTLTYDIAEERFQCQNHNLSAQLAGGMRYLDVRGRLTNNAIHIYHADRFTGYTYTDVLVTVFDFLDANPSEAVVMRLKEEGRGFGQNDLTFEESFRRYLHDDPETASRAGERFYMPESFTTLPTMGELRGKILLLQNFPIEEKGKGRKKRGKRHGDEDEGEGEESDSEDEDDSESESESEDEEEEEEEEEKEKEKEEKENGNGNGHEEQPQQVNKAEARYGVVWEGPDMVLEDLWIIPSVEHLYMKWEAIEKALTRAADPANDVNAALYLSHLSASVGVLPIEAAAGPINGTVQGMNDETGRWLRRQRTKRDRARRHGGDEEEEEEEKEKEREALASLDSHYGRTGIVIIDFPGVELVDAVLERNAGLQTR